MANFAGACGRDELRDELAKLLDDELVRCECWISDLGSFLMGRRLSELFLGLGEALGEAPQ